jgi:hypothetical protein
MGYTPTHVGTLLDLAGGLLLQGLFRPHCLGLGAHKDLDLETA